MPIKNSHSVRDKQFNQHIKALIDTMPRTLPPNDFVISYRGVPMCGKSSLKKQFAETCQKSDIIYGRKTPNGITFYDIRWSVKTYMLNAGVDKIRRDVILGHSLNGMDSQYIVVTDESLTKAMKKYTKWLDEQIDSQSLTKALTKP